MGRPKSLYAVAVVLCSLAFVWMCPAVAFAKKQTPSTVSSAGVTSGSKRHRRPHRHASPSSQSRKAKLSSRAGRKARVKKRGRARKAVPPARRGASSARPAVGGAHASDKPIPEAIRKLGPLSIGHPHAGLLLNGVKMPKGRHWRVTVPSHGYGTQEMVDVLQHCITSVQTRMPGAHPVMLGSLSGVRGGYLPPHKSHRTGRDADVYFFRKPGAKWLKAATRQDIDLPRTWALLRCFITEADPEMILIDKVPAGWLRQYAASIGESKSWLSNLFDDRRGAKTALIRPIPGHVAHMHLRLYSPTAQRLGSRHYDRLVRMGFIHPGSKAVHHRVQKGDTLSGIGQRYGVRVATIQKLNRLQSTLIRVGQRLQLRTPTVLRGIRDAVWVPPRRVPKRQRAASRGRLVAQKKAELGAKSAPHGRRRPAHTAVRKSARPGVNPRPQDAARQRNRRRIPGPPVVTGPVSSL